MPLADLAPGQHADHVHDHWWWRPGWEIGRRFYAIHITMDDQPDLCRLAATYRAALGQFDTLTPVPDRWLHLTMQGIGFTDEVSAVDLDRIAQAVTALLADYPQPELRFEDVVIGDETIAVLAEPAQPIHDIRQRCRLAIGTLWGAGHVPDHPHRYRPHVSLAYITAGGPAAPYIEAATSVTAEPARARIRHVDLIRMHRDHHMYEWDTVTRIPLAGAGA